MISLINKLIKKIRLWWTEKEDTTINDFYKYDPAQHKTKGYVKLVHGNYVWYDK